jgi:hypothetical protein
MDCLSATQTFWSGSAIPRDACGGRPTRQRSIEQDRRQPGDAAKFLVANKLPEPVTSELEIPDAWSSQ